MFRTNRMAVLVFTLFIPVAAQAQFLKVPADYSTIQAAHDATACSSTAGCTIWVAANTYSVSSSINISKPNVTIIGDRGAIVEASGTGYPTFNVAASGGNTPNNFSISGLVIKTSRATTSYDADSDAIEVTSVSNVSIRNCEIARIGMHGVKLDRVTGAVVENNYVHDFAYAGIVALSGSQIRIAKNNVSTASVTASCGSSACTNAYGIALGAEGTSNPFPTDVTIIGNTVSDIPVWTGIDMHGGQRVVISGNTVNNCRMGVHAGIPDSPGGNAVLADVVISGNTLVGPSRESTSYGSGENTGIIVSGGSATVYAKRITVSNNVVREFNHQLDSAYGGGIKLTRVDGVTVTGNTSRNNLGAGIFSYFGVKNAVISGNTLIDNAKLSTSVDGVGIYIYTTLSGPPIEPNEVTVVGNRAATTGGDDEQQYGIRAGSANTSVVLDNDLRGNSTAAIVNADYFAFVQGNTHTQNIPLYETLKIGGGSGKWTYGTSAPGSGTWAVGDVVWNTSPSAGGTMGWVCTTAGSPGTWKTFGTIAN